MDKIDFDKLNIITFNDVYAKCTEPNDAEEIIKYFVSGNKVHGDDTPKIYFFIDGVTYLVLDEPLFIKHGIFDISEFSLMKRVWLKSSSIFSYVFRNIFQEQTGVFEVKMTGAFILLPPFPQGDPNKFRVVTTDSSYINGVKISAGTCFYILRDQLGVDDFSGEFYPLPSFLYMDKYGFKHSSFVLETTTDNFIVDYHGGYDGMRFKKTETDTYFSDGIKLDKEIKDDQKGQEPPIFGIASEETYQTIVTALTKLITNPERPFLKDDEAIAKHLKKYFPKVTGLSKSTITKILAKGKPTLKEREIAEDLNEEYLIRYQNMKKELQDNKK